MSSSRSTMGITALPSEVLKIMLAHIDDLDNFLHTIWSCRLFRTTFNTHASSLTKTLIFQAVGADLVPDAIHTPDAASDRRQRPDDARPPVDVTQLLGDGNKAAATRDWRLKDAFSIIRLHAIVEPSRHKPPRSFFPTCMSIRRATRKLFHQYRGSSVSNTL